MAKYKVGDTVVVNIPEENWHVKEIYGGFNEDMCEYEGSEHIIEQVNSKNKVNPIGYYFVGDKRFVWDERFLKPVKREISIDYVRKKI